MKKCILFIFTVISALLVTGCTYEEEIEPIYFKNSLESDNMSNYTYKFIGISEHFAFETGKVYYGENNERNIVIMNFKLIKNLKNQNNIEKYSINLSFNDNTLMSGFNKLENKTIEEAISQKKIIEKNFYNEDRHGESDSFVETTKDEFKDAIKLTISYCYKNEKCETEELKFTYIK